MNYCSTHQSGPRKPKALDQGWQNPEFLSSCMKIYSAKSSETWLIPLANPKRTEIDPRISLLSPRNETKFTAIPKRISETMSQALNKCPL